MTTIDEILAMGRYTDRRGRMWAVAMADGRWGRSDGRYLIGGVPFAAEKMRLLIERDQHRGGCLGLWDCADHPVPRVAVIESDYGSFSPNSRIYDQHGTLSEAMDAARALAVEP